VRCDHDPRCADLRTHQQRQRAEWQAAIAGLHRAQRRQRGRRPAADASAYRLPPPDPLH